MADYSFKNSSTPPLITIFLLSALSLSYEVLLTRLLSIVQWHHFVYMIISIALMGYGVSGTFLTLLQKSLQKHFYLAFVVNALLFGFTSVGGFLFAQQLPFIPMELFWDSKQWLWLLLLYLLLVLPFFFVANCIGLVFLHYRNSINKIYAADLLGAALGAFGIIILLSVMFPEDILRLIISATGCAVLFVVIKLQHRMRWIITLSLILVIPWLVPKPWLSLNISEFKSLQQTLNVQGAKLIQQSSGPMSVLSVVENQQVPFRHVPGLSLTATAEPPQQLAVFYDADAMSMITRFDGDITKLKYMGEVTSALPYQLLHKPEVLVVGAGGGAEVLQALYHDAKHVDAVELNRQMISLVKNSYASFSGDLYRHPRISLHESEARGFIAATDKDFDLIQISLMDSFAASAAGLHALNESYLYTVQAFQSYFEHLSSEGLLSITRWVKLPPRDTLKLVATARQALSDSGVENPEQHIALIRTWNTATLIVKKQRINAEDIIKIKQFSRQQNFDLAYYPGIDAAVVNRFSVLPEAYFFNGATALLSADYQHFTENYKYNLQPATDNKPYFFDFMKWHALPEIMQLPASQGLALIEWGSIVLVLTLVQAFVISVILILLPLWLYFRKNSLNKPQAVPKGFVFWYFLFLGMAFMFIEIAFIQRFILFLSHPTFAIAVVLTGFLLFAGIGSGLSQKWQSTTAIKMATAGIGLIAGFYLIALPIIFDWFISSSDTVKIMLSLILISPLAFFMGIPFPHGLSLLARTSPELIPWAWGVNGCASVVSAILATLLALFAGFTNVILCALLLYLLAGVLFLRQVKRMTFDAA